jgi:YbbR domain-containing protein
VRFSSLLARNWMLKVTAFALALLLWGIVRAEEPTRVSIKDVPVEVVVGDAGWALAAPPAPASATVVFSGPFWELARLAVQRPRVVIPVEEVQDTVEMRPLRAGWVQLDGDLTRTRIDDVRPGSVLLLFERLTTRLVPVSVRTTGTLPSGMQLAGALHADPSAVRVSGPAHRLPKLDSIPLTPIDLSAVKAPAAIPVAIDTTGLAGFLISPKSIDVFVPVAPAGLPASFGPTVAERERGGSR